MRKKISYFLCAGVLFILAGCAPQYFPLKNQSYFKEPFQEKKVAIMPFDVGGVIYFSKFNTLEKLEEKEKKAEGYLIAVLKEELPNKKMRVVDYISMADLEKDDFDEDLLTVINELYNELNSANYGVEKNLKDDKKANRAFDYSIGLRTQELREKLKGHPDLIIFLVPQGYIVNLTALEPSAMNTAMAIFSLGMTALAPTTDDTIFLKWYVIDTKTGNIVWIDYDFQLSQSLLQEKDIRFIVKKLIEKFPSITY